MQSIDFPETPHLSDRLPAGSPVFLCPSCECPLEYTESRSSNGGSAPDDLTDCYRCPAGCGTLEHERRAHRFRIIGAGYAPRGRRPA